ncbi:hypothetical protein RvY_10602 [Ramazzottius varieornatus]|uniref:Uncharacterized protein n=1 Tax=Ramazzottius varieornatus TaxID=947166 RepID=A0A1D1VDA5_RAMVA|nr:hypothetical protein RvY_10602 [Ramazzottius varieornatus]
MKKLIEQADWFKQRAHVGANVTVDEVPESGLITRALFKEGFRYVEKEGLTIAK